MTPFNGLRSEWRVGQLLSDNFEISQSLVGEGWGRRISSRLGAPERNILGNLL